MNPYNPTVIRSRRLAGDLVFCACPDGQHRLTESVGGARVGYGDVTFEIPPDRFGGWHFAREVRTQPIDRLIGSRFDSAKLCCDAILAIDPDAGRRCGDALAARRRNAK